MGCAPIGACGAVAMRLRPSPIRLRDACNWPPVWVRLGRANAKAPKTLTGEMGILKEVRYHADRRGRIYLTVDNGGALYVGCLVFKNDGFCEKVFEHLRRWFWRARR